MFFYREIQEKYSRYLDELRLNNSYREISKTSCIGAFLYYDEIIKDATFGRLHPSFMVNSDTIYYCEKDSRKELISPVNGLGTILDYHMMDQPHQTTEETIDKLKKDFYLVPEEVVQKVVGFCPCQNDSLHIDFVICDEISRYVM